MADALTNARNPGVTAATSASRRVGSIRESRIARRCALVNLPAMDSPARWPASPANDCIEITTSDVPTATGIGRPPSRASAGTSRNPPPAPTSPLMMPTLAPCSMILPIGSGPVDSSSTSRRPRSMATAAAIMMSAKAISRTLPGMK